MTNLAQMMKQAQEMQQRLQDMQARMAQTEVEGQSGGGMVKVTMTVRGEMRKIKIDPKVINASDAEMLEDLVVAAVNDARAKSEGVVSSETEKMLGGMALPPGFKLPV